MPRASLRWERAGLLVQGPGSGSFVIDPRTRTERAVITHAHADHFVRGCGEYWCTEGTAPLLRHRLGPKARIIALPYRQEFDLEGWKLTFYPAGHILGSAQVRLEVPGDDRVYGVSGDFKREPDPSCEGFETFRCDHWFSESTFAHPQYVWKGREPGTLAAEILAWVHDCAREGLLPAIRAYSLGKTQRLLAELAEAGLRIGVEGEGYRLSRLYEEQGVKLGAFSDLGEGIPDLALVSSSGGIGALEARAGRRVEAAQASGWVGGFRGRRGAVGFVVSDHADYRGLLETALSTGAREAWFYPVETQHLIRELRGRGVLASAPVWNKYAPSPKPLPPSADSSPQLSWGAILNP